MPSMQSTAILATTLLGSLLQHASAAVTPTAPEALSRRAGQFPDCIATCMRNSGCFDSKCVCKSVDEGILSDIVICMNQWCPADITAKDLIGPLEGECKLPKAAVQDAEKKGGVASDDDAEEEDKADDKDDTPKPTPTPAPSGKGDKDDDKKEDKDDDEEEEIIMTYDLAPPVTNAGPVTTVTPVASGTLTVPTEAATTGLLIEASSSSGAFQAATASHHPVPSSVSADSSTKDSSSSDEDEDDKGSAAGIGSQASVFGIVAAMGFALAMGF